MNRLGVSQQPLKTLKKPGQENKRQGDWVCMLCNNLNYSFRENCNRCKNLTREENTKLYGKKDYAADNCEARQPLGEICFQRMHSLQEAHSTRRDSELQIASLRDSQRSQGNPQLQANLIAAAEQFLKPETSGFSSLLYLTPTRYRRDNC